jgi:serine/threonine kinase PknH
MSDAVDGVREGSQFGPYRLKRLLGRGGMGEVYEAEDTVKDRVVALKLLSPLLSQDPDFRDRLHREARTAGRLHEPHIVPVHDYGEIDGLFYLDMRLIQGTDLSHLLKEAGVLTPPRAVAIMRQAASALDAAHTAGVIHRDIKPENILITPDDFAYLVDFGIASATAEKNVPSASGALGTWKYAAPERFVNEQSTPSVDIYALACVLHECLTGAPPYRADTTGTLITAHLTEPIPQPSQQRTGIPPAFDAVIARGMAKNPSDRYTTAGELAQAANDALSAPDQDRAEHIVERSADATAPSIQRTSRPQPPPTPTAAAGSRHHDLPPTATSSWDDWHGLSPYQQTPARKAKPPAKMIAALITAALAVTALIIWLIPSANQPTTPADTTPTTMRAAPTTPPSPTPPPAESQARLISLLPGGYPPGACTAATPSPGTLALLQCGQNIDPGGPPAGSYFLYSDATSTRQAFDKIVTTSTVLDCPGRIQSPGNWHRNAAPDQVAGTLMCGIHQGYPTVAWTNNAGMLVATVQATVPGTDLDQLYEWWMTHS